MRAWRPIIYVTTLAVLPALGVIISSAQQQTAVCSETPGTGERIECTKGATSSDNIELTTNGIDIDTTDNGAHGVYGKHEGAGFIDIDVLMGVDASDQVINSAIDTAGVGAHGVYGHHTGAGKIDIDVNSTDITTASEGARGVIAFHEGDGDIDIYFGNGSIETTGTYENGNDPELLTHGIYGGHEGFGDIGIVASNVRITTAGKNASGIRGSIEKTGQAFPEDAVNDISITASNVDVTTTGKGANGIIGWHRRVPVCVDCPSSGESEESRYISSRGKIEIDVQGGTIKANDSGWGITGVHDSEGDIFIDVRDLDVRTQGEYGYAIFGKRRPTRYVQNGNLDISAENLTIETSGGQGGYGIFGWQQNGNGYISIDVQDTTITTNSTSSNAVYGRFDGLILGAGDGDVTIDIRDSTFMTKGINSHGVRVFHEGTGDISITTRGVAITTESVAIDPDPDYLDTFSHGIFANHQNPNEGIPPVDVTGNIDIDVQGGSIEARGTYSYGIWGNLEAGNGGEISIVTGGGNTITTTGPNGHGIVAYHYGTAQASSKIAIDVGGNIDVSGAGAQGVLVGIVNADGAPERVAAIGADGYRQQTVTVNGPVYGGSGEAAGVFLAGGGRVVIGPRGSIASESGIAILATGDTPGVDGARPSSSPGFAST